MKLVKNYGWKCNLNRRYFHDVETTLRWQNHRSFNVVPTLTDRRTFVEPRWYVDSSTLKQRWFHDVETTLFPLDVETTLISQRWNVVRTFTDRQDVLYSHLGNLVYNWSTQYQQIECKTTSNAQYFTAWIFLQKLDLSLLRQWTIMIAIR